MVSIVLNTNLLTYINVGSLIKGELQGVIFVITGKNFTDFTGTIFANKYLPLGEMFYILANEDIKSIKRLSKELGHKWDSVYCITKDSADAWLTSPRILVCLEKSK